jgi:hypothetical protein
VGFAGARKLAARYVLAALVIDPRHRFGSGFLVSYEQKTAFKFGAIARAFMGEFHRAPLSASKATASFRASQDREWRVTARRTLSGCMSSGAKRHGSAKPKTFLKGPKK